MGSVHRPSRSVCEVNGWGSSGAATVAPGIGVPSAATTRTWTQASSPLVVHGCSVTDALATSRLNALSVGLVSGPGSATSPSLRGTIVSTDGPPAGIRGLQRSQHSKVASNAVRPSAATHPDRASHPLIGAISTALQPRPKSVKPILVPRSLQGSLGPQKPAAATYLVRVEAMSSCRCRGRQGAVERCPQPVGSIPRARPRQRRSLLSPGPWLGSGVRPSQDLPTDSVG